MAQFSADHSDLGETEERGWVKPPPERPRECTLLIVSGLILGLAALVFIASGSGFTAGGYMGEGLAFVVIGGLLLIIGNALLLRGLYRAAKAIDYLVHRVDGGRMDVSQE